MQKPSKWSIPSKFMVKPNSHPNRMKILMIPFLSPNKNIHTDQWNQNISHLISLIYNNEVIERDLLVNNLSRDLVFDRTQWRHLIIRLCCCIIIKILTRTKKQK